MDYQTAENQAMQLQSHADDVAQNVSALAGKLQSKIADESLARELTLDLREAALAIQKQNQQTLMLVEQMAQYIHQLEGELSSPQQTSFQPRGWSSQPYGGGGSFMGNVVSGLGMGAGFGLANDIVGGLFNAL